MLGVIQHAYAPDPKSAFLAADMLSVVRDKSALDRRYQADTGIMPRSIMVLDGVYPTWYFASSQAGELLLCNCIQTASQGVSLWDEYANILTTQIATAENAWLRSWVDSIEAAILAANIGRNSTKFAAGFSAGGAAASVWMCDRLREARVGNRCLITFGSPKPFNRESANIFLESTVRHFMMDGDPVPNIPPQAAALHLFGPVYSIAQLTKVMSFVHPPGGVILFPDGRWEAGQINASSPQGYALSFGSWLLSQVTGSGTPHDFQGYLDAVTPWDIGPDDPSQPNIGGGGFWPNDPPTTPMIVAAQLEGFRNIVSGQQARGNLEPSIPPLQLFHARRIGRLWIVEFQGQRVAVSPSRRSAQSMARKGNAFLREMLPQAVTDPRSIIDAFRFFVDEAQDPASGITPQLSVVWPGK